MNIQPELLVFIADAIARCCCWQTTHWLAISLSLSISFSLSLSHSPLALVSGGCLCSLRFSTSQRCKTSFNLFWPQKVCNDLLFFACVLHFIAYTQLRTRTQQPPNRISVIDLSPCHIASALNASHRRERDRIWCETRIVDCNYNLFGSLGRRDLMPEFVCSCVTDSMCVWVWVLMCVYLRAVLLLFYHCFRAALRCICVDCALASVLCFACGLRLLCKCKKREEEGKSVVVFRA